MAALTNDTNRKLRDGDLQALPVKGSTRIYKGGLSCTDTNGLLVPGADAAGYKYQGPAIEPGDNTDGSDGDLTVVVDIESLVQAHGTGFTQADIGKEVFIVDDDTVALVTTHSVYAGRIAEVYDATTVWFDRELPRLHFKLGDLTDVSEASATAGMGLTYQTDGTWAPAADAD